MNSIVYTPGNPKRNRKYDPEWFKRISLKAYTDIEWTERFREMTVREQFDFIKVFVPKEVKVDQSSTFRLVIEGLQHKAIQGEVVSGMALEAHEDDGG
jgi:hypothetical protein